ncbi:Hypothetical predicted protein [Paramuricea clavata]|uniref:Uncharacterized protein n=1 Tax=Paramuricea clavata TaxID=317549 RepID=A0A7D9IDJ5_PARCT|nr:Hypothetical predicted protein [Paramuricea clavata]
MTFALNIFESEFKEITDFVSRYPNIETGGDLFGLWKANGDPVVQLIIGPGKNCRRTSVSFHQDTDYLASVGTYVNTSYMLCHIGSWHSHHQLSLMQPSAGDRSTVCNNFPEGLKRYIMIIANITQGVSSRQSVVIHPYMFTDGGHVCKQGKVSIISWGSPFREVGYVMTLVANGAEQCLSTKEAYSSRAPLEYHNRPSTRSKPISAAPGNVKTIYTNNESHSMKVDKNFNQSSTWSKHHHDQNTRSNPMHQNYFSTDSVPEPMDVDPPDYHKVTLQESTKPQHQVTENHDTKQPTQWYDTEEGGAKLKEIDQEIRTTMTNNIGYSRNTYSKNLTIEFTHYGQKWTIDFPELFDNEPALISNSHYGKGFPSRNVIGDIRKACRCHQCQNKIIHCQHSPSKDNHPLSSPKRDHSPSRAKRSPPHIHSKNVQSPSPPKQDPSPPLKDVHHVSRSRQGRYSPYDHDKRPQSRRVSKSPQQPWYNTEIGKPIVQKIKSDIETYLKTTSNVGRVRAMDTATSKGRTKHLIFYHNGHDWIIEFVSSSQVVELKIDRYGQKKCVATLGSPYDVVRELKHHCFCIRCLSTRRSPSAGQRRQRSALTRPNSRYVDRRSPTRVSPTRVSSTSKFFATEKGEEKFGKICTQINTLFLNGRNVDISRLHSKDIEVKFEHNRRQWKIMFPFGFPEASPKLDFAYMHQTVDKFYPASVSNDNVLRAIRKKCNCSSCRRYPY